jgi:acyl-CoA synthetase (AMP-forming)/AMP-acid ligase II
MEAYYTLAQLGVISVPINYRLSPTDVAFILDDSDSTVVIADRGFAHLVAAALEAGGRAIETVVWMGKGEQPHLRIESVDYEDG